MPSPRTLSRHTLPVVLMTCLLLPTLSGAGPGSPQRPARLAPGPHPGTGQAAQRASVEQTQTRWQWPLTGRPRLVRSFSPPPQPWLPGHRGVDLAGSTGASVLAAGGGVVRYAGTLAGRGVISIEHADGLRTTYEPVTAIVRIGDEVAVGTPIGVLDSGHVGCSASAPDSCLHWGLRRGDDYLDPLAVLGLGRVRLLPLTG